MRIWPILLFLPLRLLAQDDLWDDDSWDDAGQESLVSGYVDAGFGTRFDSDAALSDGATLGELRWRLERDWQIGDSALSLKADAGYDAVDDEWDVDARELAVAFTVGETTDVKVGRQVQTWGTGDLLFLNDLFPKDFVSFFAGRDDEYLKAPGNAVRLTHYASAANLDFVWTPVFQPDVYLTGERFSFYSPAAGRNVAPVPPLRAVEPGESFDNGEFALRVFRTVEGREYAVYAYSGFFKQPSALTPDGRATFSALTSLGASLRRPFGPGLFNTELAYYASRDDRDGSDPLVPNDQARFLVGYEWEAKPNFTIGLQYYLEYTLDHDELIASSAHPNVEPDEFRHVVTNRLTYRMGRDRHTLSLFTFLSPSDRDFYIRPVYGYRHDDRWSVTAGANLFGGDEPHTFFNQLRDASNAYVRIRFSY